MWGFFVLFKGKELSIQTDVTEAVIPVLSEGTKFCI